MITLVYSLDPPLSRKGVKEWKYRARRVDDQVPDEILLWLIDNHPEYREPDKAFGDLADQWCLSLRAYDEEGYRINKDGSHGPERRADL